MIFFKNLYYKSYKCHEKIQTKKYKVIFKKLEIILSNLCYIQILQNIILINIIQVENNKKYKILATYLNMTIRFNLKTIIFPSNNLKLPK
jgi:hypothetical protein